MSANTNRPDVYTRVTDRIIAALEQGIRPWQKPWNSGHAAGSITRPLRANGQHYRGINVVLLWMTAEERGYSCPVWMTYQQAQELGGQVRKGERGTQVVYANTFTVTDETDEGEEIERQIPFMRGYTVFNAEQIEGLPGHYYPTGNVAPLDPSTRIAAADRFFAGTGAVIREGGNRAFYSPGTDHIQMPPFEDFRDAESYAATLAHELIHWTGHTSRLSRTFGRRFGDQAYAREELVAELGSAFLCADLKITHEVRQDHADYIGAWLQVLREDKRAIFNAAAHAQRAADYLHSIQVPQAAAA